MCLAGRCAAEMCAGAPLDRRCGGRGSRGEREDHASGLQRDLLRCYSQCYHHLDSAGGMDLPPTAHDESHGHLRCGGLGCGTRLGGHHRCEDFVWGADVPRRHLQAAASGGRRPAPPLLRRGLQQRAHPPDAGVGGALSGAHHDYPAPGAGCTTKAALDAEDVRSPRLQPLADGNFGNLCLLCLPRGRGPQGIRGSSCHQSHQHAYRAFGSHPRLGERLPRLEVRLLPDERLHGTQGPPGVVQRGRSPTFQRLYAGAGAVRRCRGKPRGLQPLLGKPRLRRRHQSPPSPRCRGSGGRGG
mmetsp:Transcript_39629/g.84494  ORF Transcript_39629/g.84494 Transcript_39629/m.84494 type:complete len:299 (-) Transcript_39629:549-1445(-)